MWQQLWLSSILSADCRLLFAEAAQSLMNRDFFCINRSTVLYTQVRIPRTTFVVDPKGRLRGDKTEFRSLG